VSIPGRLIRKEKQGCEIWGTDISNEIIEKNKKDKDGTKYFQGTIGYQDFLPSDYFDVVFSGEVIEHMDDPNLLFKEAYRILKKGGKLLITTPLVTSVDSPEHVWYFTKDDVKKLYLDNGFKNVTFKDLPDMEYLMVIFSIGVK
jgi:ubiquinone/menaquinone biosynthesis C-methylase UbiE